MKTRRLRLLYFTLRRRARRGALFAVSAIVLGGTARAEPERVSLRWSAPETCPGATAVKAEVDRLLGPGAARPPKPIEVSAAVSRDAQGVFHVVLETPGEGAARVREMHAASCAAIADATALILAMMIDPAAVASASPPVPASTPLPSGPSRAPTPAPLAGPAPAPPLPTSSSPAPPRPHPSGPVLQRARSAPPPLSFRSLLWAGADVGSLPAIAGGLGLTAALLYGPQRFEIGGAIWPGRSKTIARRSAGGTVDLAVASAGTCRDFAGGRIEIGPCIGVEMGLLHAKGFGVTDPGEAAELWAALKGGGALGWSPWSWVSLVLRLDVVVPLSRPTFVLEGIGPVHRASVVVGRTAAGVEVHF